MVFRSKKPYSNKTTRKNKSKYKSTKPNKQTLYSKKYKQQKGGDKQYIVTIAVITHGCIITTEPEQKIYNIRLYNSSGNNIDICGGNVPERSIHHDELKLFFRKDSPTPDPKNTNETVQSIPHPFDVMPYDKIIGPDNPEIFDATIDNLSSFFLSDTPVGVWLISVHDNHKLVFPNTEQKETHYNLLSIHFLNHLMFNFNKEKYLVEHNHITKTLESKHKFPPAKFINGIRQIRNFDNWNVTLNTEKTHIKFIRLSYLFDWLKYIFGVNVNLNVYDYSCTINCNVDEHPIIPPLITDIEMGPPPFINTIGGTKPKKKNKKKKKTI
jgi:hypothetical protein